jgi:hypothetical protein
MSVSTTSVPNPAPDGMVLWPHTSLVAPYYLNVQEVAQLDLGVGVAYRATLVHPTLGAVGRIVNHGDGSDTIFYPTDETIFGHDELEQFAQRCSWEGRPLGWGTDGTRRLLTTAFNEAGYARSVASMFAKDRFLVRYYDPSGPGHVGTRRGPAVAWSRVCLDRRDRELIIEQLAARPDMAKPERAIWQMYNGRDWADLLPAPALDADDHAARVEAVRALRRDTADPQDRLHREGPLTDGLYVSGGHDRYVLASDRDAVARAKIERWCRCPHKRPLRSARWQYWSPEQGVLASGHLHAAPRCRRLLILD